MGYRVAPHQKKYERWQQWNNDQCPLCKDRLKPKRATHLFICTALGQQAIQEEAVQLAQDRADPLQDQKLVALSFMNQLFQFPTCLPCYDLPGNRIPTTLLIVIKI